MFGSALRLMSCSTMRSLPLNAAAASGVTPERPGRFGSAPFARREPTVACRSFSAASNSAVEPSRLRASIAAPCSISACVSARCPARAARASAMLPSRSRELERGAGRQQPACEIDTAGIHRAEQRHVQLDRGSVRRRFESEFEVAAGRGLRREYTGGRGRQRSCGHERFEAGRGQKHRSLTQRGRLHSHASTQCLRCPVCASRRCPDALPPYKLSPAAQAYRPIRSAIVRERNMRPLNGKLLRLSCAILAGVSIAALAASRCRPRNTR